MNIIAIIVVIALVLLNPMLFKRYMILVHGKKKANLFEEQNEDYKNKVKVFFSEKDQHRKFLKAIGILEHHNKYLYQLMYQIFSISIYFIIFILIVSRIFGNELIIQIPMFGYLTWIGLFIPLSLIMFFTLQIKKMFSKRNKNDGRQGNYEEKKQEGKAGIHKTDIRRDRLPENKGTVESGKGKKGEV